MRVGHNDLGRPVAYPAIADGTPVYEPDGDRIGVVDEVVADEPDDIFHGIVLHTVPLPGRHLYADADQIAGLYEHGVLLGVRRNSLRPPERPRRGREHDAAAATGESRLEAALRHAWDWITNHSGSR
ncbi:MAG: hypothetical protein QOI68_1428 [Pseudonocardiales bacterium]|nr:hypothetical protein [Pseudonocardiales bacterium]